MHINAKPPIFVPKQFRAEIEKLSKSALMDLVWDLATLLAKDSNDDDGIMAVIRDHVDVVKIYRDEPIKIRIPSDADLP